MIEEEIDRRTLGNRTGKGLGPYKPASDKKSARLNIGITHADKSAWALAARDAGLSITQWVVAQLNKSINLK